MNKFFFGLALGCLVPVISSPAWAGFQEGADAYTKGDYQTAMNEWLPLAQGGNAQAENAVGAMYDNGLGVTSDEAEAFRWYSMAADQNYPLAMRNLGTMYATGHGAPYSLEQAQQWLGRAAGAGDQVAAQRLAALPPVGSTAENPLKTPLPPIGSTASTDTTSTGTSTFGSNSGPSSLLAQTPPQPATTDQTTTTQASSNQASTDQTGNSQASTTQVPATQQVADASASTNTATVPAVSTASTDGGFAPAPASGPLTFPPQPAATASTISTDQASSNQTSATQTAAVQPATNQGGAAVAAASDATPGSAADGWHAFDDGDYKTALAIWQPLAQSGDSNLQVLVGSLYDYGQGVPQDKKQALQWYLLAAQQGSGRGQYAAGALLVKDAKQRNLVEAYKWLTVAGDTLKGQGGDIAASQAISLRQQIAKEMSKDDIAKAETLAQSFHAG